MRKQCLWLLVGLMLPLCATAQVKWMVKSGIGSSTFIANSGEDSRLFYRLGGGAIVPLSKRWNLTPALYFSKKGFTFRGAYGSKQIDNAHFSVGMNYVELPVTVGHRLELGKDCGFSFYLGPYVACGLSAKARVALDNGNYKHTFKENLFAESCDMMGLAYNEKQRKVTLPRFERVDTGLQMGFELDIDRILLGVEMDYGITPVAHQPIVDPNIVSEIVQKIFFNVENPHHLILQITAGYRF